ncbi:MAG TPA: nucleotide exchange factor GrpE [Candidatus Dormibacteraeota bacterium]|nr:nucleotide exchange factor GrpE [Candidatus Dormibacteraeota bacterium]
MDDKENKRNVRNIDESNDDSGEDKAFAAEGKAEDDGVRKAMEDLEELRKTMLRRQADFDNYRKRIERERGEDAKRATARVIENLIPVLDGFEQALAAHREAEYESYRKGFELIYKQLMENIVKLGAERAEPVGKSFDPHLHQAMDRTETTEHPDGTILQVFQPGYLFHGRVLRPAMVRVAVHPAAASKAGVN